MALALRLGTMARRTISSARRAASVIPWEVENHTIVKNHFSTIHGPTGDDGLPISVDWRGHGVDPVVRKQFCCGGCWAFATVESIQSLNMVHGNKALPLSVQQLLDCMDVNADGCYGGHPLPAFYYIELNGGLLAESAYPFLGWHRADDSCKKGMGMGVTIGSYECYRNVGENMLKYLVARQPVIVSIGANFSFQYYGGMVLPTLEQRWMLHIYLI